MIPNSFQQQCDQAVTAERFSVRGLSAALQETLAGSAADGRCRAVATACCGGDLNWLLQVLVRATFLIELVKQPKIETTKFEVRWADRLGTEDPRFASFPQCVEAFEHLLNDLDTQGQQERNRTLVQTFQTQALLPYEAPVDYEDAARRPIHRATNLEWVWTDTICRSMALRLLLRNDQEHAELFSLIYDKVRVKTYLTDRVLTGEHKTNREKRWEVHPNSVHFATRRTCMEIEYALINQVCHFAGFPAGLKARLGKAGLLTAVDDPFCCPITLEPMSFDEFEREVRAPEMGKASFQVGHLNPLKAGANGGGAAGHTADNIAWVSADGNRIQGHLSLDGTRAMLKRIQNNYERRSVAAKVGGR